MDHFCNYHYFFELRGEVLTINTPFKVNDLFITLVN